jgi:hypothetical protein
MGYAPLSVLTICYHESLSPNMPKHDSTILKSHLIF